MSKGSKKIGMQLLGLNKSQVDRHMEKLVNSNNDKLSQIKAKIQVLKVENEKISEEISSVTDEITAQKKSQGTVQFGLKKCEEIVLLINKAAQDEVDALSSEWRKKELEMDNEIDEYNTVIHNTKENIEKLLQNVIISNDSFNHIIKTHPEMTAENKEIIEQEEILEKEVAIGKEEIVESVIPLEKKEDENMQDSFWGDDLGNYIVTNNEQQDISSEIEDNKIDEKIDLEQQDKKTEPSEEMEIEIKNIKNNYLVGKIVGEDLLDNSGNLIANKNEYITEEMIKRVENSGKLMDLILNMSIPDQSA